ncbi:transglutaminase domain-containing protein [Polycyclovorans algicola]|uniref:transglutaminase domain-containing protein n=1 Tax=Polycyclovorans algicola TaxID=616992 RepID=UPI0004A6FD13|nr:transglutaminase family protein [Polycyclovorans algicola]
MRLRTQCELHFEITVPTAFILMLRPRSGAHQWVAREEYEITPRVPVFEFTDGYGNLCQRLVAPPGQFSVHTVAEVITSDGVDRAPDAPFVDVQLLPDGVLNFLLPSRYCESDHFNEMAASITAGYWLGYDQVAAIETWLRQTYEYVPGSTGDTLSAIDVNARTIGICRDFAHLGIALCRALSIPARMVVGYLHGLQPMDLHAWFEAYVGGRWYTFDATQAELTGGYVALGYGRDAADVAVFNQFGPASFATHQSVNVERLPD